ncbi:RluA family pseudouridine synthase [Parachlamydia sp. AcF125]|uniref:RluA family pseudouridine synthase n=1 Tax=Parachlamydia sp. AcF125 TaxID=2795736 RepID=UPI001BC965C4|nr:RluA family pseudouridine synthase [Parachlamydia sp. AcF125]MBS4168559.1 putative RNA pseudouridine synthase [Parachlamydia sp. AcF125]
MHIWKVASSESGMTLGAFLKRKFEDVYSAKQLKRAIEHHLFRVNQRVERFASTRVATGDQIECDHQKLQSFFASPMLKFEAKRVLYEDSDLFIYDKPAGINCDSTGIVRLVHQQDPSLQLIHRLDRETTGVLLFAKSESILQKMIYLFKLFKVRKTYYAIVDGLVNKEKGTIDNNLAPLHKYQGQTVWGQTSGAKGVHACTDWIREKKGTQCSLMRCHPITGVTHQIRVHMSEMGHPILGDYQYGRQFRCPYQPSRYLLHAYEIIFPHPATGKEIKLIAELPSDFKQALEQLRLI